MCWSCEVVLLSVLPEGLNPFATTCITSLIGATLLAMCFAKRIASALKSDGAVLVKRIVFLSLLNASYNVLIEIGLEDFDLSVGAFTFSMVAVILPVLMLVMRRGVSMRAWIAALLVFSGIVVAAWPALSTINLNGLGIVLASCLARALYIVKLSDYVREHDPVTLSAGISANNAIVTFIPWLFIEPLTFGALPWSAQFIAILVIYSYFIVAFATVLNTFAQRRTTPTQATIIYATEIIFSIIWAACLPEFFGERMTITPFIITGCALIVLGNIVEIIPVGKLSKKRNSSSEEDEAAMEVRAIADEESAHEAALSRKSTADLATQILLRFNHPATRKIVLFFILLAVYLIISLPFKVISVIPGFSDIRPVCMLQPVYGIFFGIPGCLAFAVGNVISDIMSDSLRWTSIAGFIGNFMFPFLMYLYWTRIRKKPFNLRTRRRLIGMVGSILFCSLVESLIICPAVAIVYPEVDIILFTISVVANTSVFSIAFAIPFIILIQEELGFMPLSKHAGKRSAF